jgi:hypothetical protein
VKRPFIAWAIGHDPELRVIYSSFSDRLGIRANLRLQRALDSKRYQRLFPNTRLNDKHIVTIAERHLRNHEVLEFVGHEGYFRNTTVLGSITGEALDLSVIDDPIKGRAEASSEVTREKTWMWLTDDVFSRFSETAGLIMITTRWHVDDPAGRLIEHFGDRVTIAKSWRGRITRAPRPRARRRMASVNASTRPRSTSSIALRSAKRYIVQSTSCSPIWTRGSKNTMRHGHIRDVGASAKPRCRPSWMQCR